MFDVGVVYEIYILFTFLNNEFFLMKIPEKRKW